jgi:hypothetical protein
MPPDRRVPAFREPMKRLDAVTRRAPGSLQTMKVSLTDLILK